MTTDNYLRNYAIKITEHLKSLFQDLKNIDHFLRGWGGWGSPQLLFNLANFFSPGQTLYSLLSDFPCQVPPPCIRLHLAQARSSTKVQKIRHILSPTLRIVNKTSTEATLAPGIDQQYSTNSLAGVHNVVQLGLSHNNIDLYGAHNWHEFSRLLLDFLCLFCVI